MSYTPLEIKEIKQKRKLGYVLAFWLFFFGTFGITVYSFGQDFDYSVVKYIARIFILIGFCVLVIRGINRKLNKDLKFEERLIEDKTIDKLYKQMSYEAGSGTLHNGILGSLFPKIWGQEMKGTLCFYLIAKGIKYEIKEEMFNQLREGDIIEIHWSKYGEVFLGIKTKNQKTDYKK